MDNETTNLNKVYKKDLPTEYRQNDLQRGPK
jgi:hypothetical protein